MTQRSSGRDALGSTAYSYNTIGQLLSEDGPWENDAVTYTYANRLRSGLGLNQAVGAAWTQSYAYDSIKRLTNVTSAAGAFGYQYDSVDHDPAPAQLVVRIDLPGGAAIANTFDYRGRQTGTALKNSSATVLNQHLYDYDDAHRRTRQTRTVGTGSTPSVTNFVDYAYDGIGQLIGAAGQEFGGSTNRLHEKLGYRYDSVGNLSQRTNNAFVQTFRLNKLNQLTNAIRSGTYTVAGNTHGPATSVTVNSLTAERYADGTYARAGFTLSNGTNTFTAVGVDSAGRGDTNVASVHLPSTNTFAYDLNGNLKTNTTRTFDYDDENQLTRVTEPSAWKAEFTYDGKLRMRLSKDYEWRNGAWVLTNEIRRVYDGMLVVQERDQFNVPKLTYTRGKDLSGSLEGAGGIGGLLALSEMSNLSSPIHSYYHCDGNGNVTCLVDTNQNVVARYLFDPFGNTLSATGPKAAVNRYRFSSKPIHEPSGMYDYLRRWYVPELQRWGNRDPIEDAELIDEGPNLYTFVGNDPIDVLDTDGRAAFRFPKLPKKPKPQPQPKPQPKPQPRNCGDCTPGQHAAMQVAVDAACKSGKRACDNTQTCDQLRDNAIQNLECALARSRINKKCFKGGDPGHRQSADEARNAAANCWKVYAQKNCE